jgi:hypothetical protein
VDSRVFARNGWGKKCRLLQKFCQKECQIFVLFFPSPLEPPSPAPRTCGFEARQLRARALARELEAQAGEVLDVHVARDLNQPQLVAARHWLLRQRLLIHQWGDCRRDVFLARLVAPVVTQVFSFVGKRASVVAEGWDVRGSRERDACGGRRRRRRRAYGYSLSRTYPGPLMVRELCFFSRRRLLHTREHDVLLGRTKRGESVSRRLSTLAGERQAARAGVCVLCPVPRSLTMD